MRVGIDYLPALSDLQGRGRYVRELVRAMGDLRFDGNLGLFGYGGEPVRLARHELGLTESKAQLVRLRFPRRWTPWLLGKLSKGVDDLIGGCEVYHHTRPDSLHVRSAVEMVTIGDCTDGLDRGQPEDAGYASPKRAIQRHAAWKTLIERAERILVPSEYVGAEVVMSFGINPGRVTVTSPGCDHIVRTLPPGGYPPATAPYLLTVGRIEARRNHLRMLQAFELLCRDGHPQRWIVVGSDGFGAHHFHKALASSPVRDRVELRRHVDETELTRLYAQADVLLWVSLNEGFGLPPLEAMACDTPVVTSHVTAMPEVCADAAFLVEPTDPERIFEATRRLLQEDDIRASFIERGRARAREFTWRECARNTLLAYQAALKSTGEEPRMQGLF
ncbi:MAG: glycosyltransferase involved in cell wall biosynthesis [Chlamydiales bacterium]|jgi:glycosyltransferase involved in cell wall biosynthesis